MVTGKQIVEAAKKHLGEPYLYGCKHEKLTLEKYNQLKGMYGSGCVWDSDKSKVGKVCCDCSGLCYIAIKEAGGGSYLWGSSQFKERAKIVKPISDVSNAPIGAFLWMKGHIGIYIGNNQYIAEDGSKYGCRIAKLSANKWTHYLLMDFIDYDADSELSEAVHKIAVAGYKINEAAWNDVSKMKVMYVPGLITKLGGIDGISQRITSKGMSFDLELWKYQIKTGAFNVSNVRALLIKFAKTL